MHRPAASQADDTWPSLADERALIIADSPLNVALAAQLEANGMLVTAPERVDLALRAVYGARPALVVLADALRDGDPIRVLQQIRDVADIPVLMVGRNSPEGAAVAAFRAGADDYIAEPRRLDEFTARAAALLRRAVAGSRPRTNYRDGLLEVDFEKVQVRVGGNDPKLSPVEYRLLTAFIRSPDHVLSHRQLLERVWNDPTAPTRRVVLYVRYLREKLSAVGARDPIETVPGFGYRYVPSHIAEAAVSEEVPPAIHPGFEPMLAPLDDLRGSRGQPFFATPAARTELARVLIEPPVIDA